MKCLKTFYDRFGLGEAELHTKNPEAMQFLFREISSSRRTRFGCFHMPCERIAFHSLKIHGFSGFCTKPLWFSKMALPLQSKVIACFYHVRMRRTRQCGSIMRARFASWDWAANGRNSLPF